MSMIRLDAHTPDSVALDMAAREKARRRERGLSQAELAERSGVSLGSLRRFEQTGRISFDSLLRLSFSLGCEEDFLAPFSRRDYSSIQEVIESAERNRRNAS